ATSVTDLTRDLPGIRLVVAFGDAGDGAVPFDDLLSEPGAAPAWTGSPDGPSTIGYTSGTTGHPKGAVQSHRAVILNCGLTATMLADEGLNEVDLSTLTRCTVGGQTMPESTMERWQERSGAPLIELWGMTEISGLGTTHPLHARGPLGSIGVALPGVQSRIAD